MTGCEWEEAFGSDSHREALDSNRGFGWAVLFPNSHDLTDVGAQRNMMLLSLILAATLTWMVSFFIIELKDLFPMVVWADPKKDVKTKKNVKSFINMKIIFIKLIPIIDIFLNHMIY